MAASNVCWGIEVGAGGIKALKCRLDGDRVVALDYANIQHPKVLSTPELDVDDALRVALGTLTSQFDLSKATIAVSVPGHSSFARFAKLPPVEPKKVPDIVKFEAVQQIPFALEQVEWDYQTFQRPDSPDVEVGIFAITRERVMERLNMLAGVSITPDIVTLSPVAAYNALAYDLQFIETTPGTIILDIGTTSTDLVVAEAGCVWIRTFPLGGHQFTETLVNQFKLSYPKADKIKRDVSDSKHARQVFQAMRPVFTDLTQDVTRSIGYYQSLHRDAQLTRLIGVGSTFNLPGLRKYLKQQLSMDVYRLEEFKRLDLSELGEERSAAFKSDALSMATAYGLALQGLGLTPIRANLMPTSVVRESMWGKKKFWFIGTAAAAAIGGGALFLHPFLQSEAVKSATPDPVIMQAVSLAGKLRGEAQAAGVLGAGDADATAANMMLLLEKRDIYPMVLKDLSAMLEDANAQAATWSGRARPGEDPKPPIGAPGFELESFRTSYVPPGGNQDPNQPDAAPQAGSEFAKIRVSMRVNTHQPDAQAFMLQTIAAWLRANKEREGVPYTLEFREPMYTLQKAGTAPEEEIASGDGDTAPTEVADQGDPRLQSDRGGGRRGRMEQPESTISGYTAEEEAEMRARGEITDVTGPRGGGGANDAAGLAPLSMLKEAPPPSRSGEASVFTVEYEIVLGRKDASKEGGK